MQIQDDLYEYTTQGVQCLKKVIENDRDYRITVQDKIFKKFILPKDYTHLCYYTSSWGKEFMKQDVEVGKVFMFENTKGRCGAESNPFFTIGNDQQKIDLAIATSGNYRVKLKNLVDHIEVVIDDPNESFSVSLEAGESYHYPKIYMHRYRDLKQCYEEKQKYMKNFYEVHQLHNELEVIYNHWWAYEDFNINEEVILQNAKIAKELGVEMLVLDAGWFGNSQSEEHWFDIRGDWTNENRERFPHGISYLSKQIRDMGLKFGIWCEFEGLGINAEILKKHPEYQGKRDGVPLGYACFANPEVQDWAITFICSLMDQYHASYWKLDFNLDPGIGCNEEHHNHERNNGLRAHEQGVYRVLSILRERYPSLVIENCSSGGQRINLAMAEYTDVHFMSDPDYSSHQMRLFIEISKWFLPRQILHFMWSNTTMAKGDFVDLDVNKCSKKELQYHMRLAFLHQMGISRRLPEHHKNTLLLMKQELEMYKKQIRVFIKDGLYYPLVLDQDIQVFQFTLKEETLCFIFTEKAGTYEVILEQKETSIVNLDTLQKEHIKSNILHLDVEEDLECQLYIIEN